MANTLRIKPAKKLNSIEHENRPHALLSASGSSRWINCTPSAKLEEKYGKQTTSDYAQEGTLAHEISELYIKHDILKSLDDFEFSYQLETLMENELFNEEILNTIPVYVDYCASEYNSAKSQNSEAVMEIEQKLDLTEYVPESFGTADCIIINDGTIEVIDLKYGKGVPVYADANRQLMLYGLGALRKFDVMYDIQNIKLTIVQPRINNISTWQISVKDLIYWAETELKPAAKLAFEGKGEIKAGSWCKFCSVKNQCKALAEQQLEIAKYEFKKPELLSDDEISDILKRAHKFIEWINSIEEYAQTEAYNGNKVWPGFKVVEGISRRKWIDEEKVIDTLYSRFPELSDDQIFDTKLVSISQIEKLLGKKAVQEKLSDVIIKPQGKPTLVPDTDKRPSIGIEDAINDFK